MAEIMRIKIDPVAFIEWCREQGDSWEKIVAIGALINEETGEVLSGEEVWEWYQMWSNDTRTS